MKKLLQILKKNNCKNCLRNVLISFLCGAMLFTACSKKEERKSAACKIESFVVDGIEWDVNGVNITHTYPAETQERTLTPTITLSEGATIEPSSGKAQNFFAEQGVSYIVTAEDGVTTETYTAKATRAPYTGCDILSFSVNDVAWSIDGTSITYVYPPETTEGTLTPDIVLSLGATVNPSSGEAQNFFTTSGVTYTVTAEDGVTQKTYTVKATRTPYAGCNILSFSVNDVAWDISGRNITHLYLPADVPTTLTPVITLSPGATVNPPSNSAQNFFTASGVTYTVTAEDGATTKTYVVRAVTSGVAGRTIDVTVENGSAYANQFDVYALVIYEESSGSYIFNEVAKSDYNNGRFTLNLSETVPDKYLIPIVNVIGGETSSVALSNHSAKQGLMYIYAVDESGKIVGQFFYKTTDNEDVVWYYASADVSMIGDYTYSGGVKEIYNAYFKKGWNKLYFKKVDEYKYEITTQIPTNVKWYYKSADSSSSSSSSQSYYDTQSSVTKKAPALLPFNSKVRGDKFLYKNIKK
jgi:hypothetical protein